MFAFFPPPTMLAFLLSSSLPALKSKHPTCHLLLQDSLGQCNWQLVLSSFLKLLSIWFKHLLSALFPTQRSARDSDRVVLRQNRYKRRAIWQNLYKCKLHILFDLRVHLEIYPTGILWAYIFTQRQMDLTGSVQKFFCGFKNWKQPKYLSKGNTYLYNRVH